MMNMTKNNLTVSDIIAFVHKAIENNMEIDTASLGGNYLDINIKRSDNTELYFNFFNHKIAINSSIGGYLEKEYSYTDRERLNLRVLTLEIKEYKETQAAKLFNNFFTPNNTPTSIDDLNDLDD